MRFYNKKQLLTLKAKIKGLAAEGLRTRQILQTKSGKARAYYWDLKRYIGNETRLHLIAYGLLRGKRFSQIEPNTKLKPAKASDDYSRWYYWEMYFPWEKLLTIILSSVSRPDYGMIDIGGRYIYGEHKYWTLENLKSLVLKDRPLPNSELYGIRILEKIEKAS